MGLYQKHRPSTFDGVIGNKEVVASLKTILARPKEHIPKAFLLSGPSGCGKTTIARIIRDVLGCAIFDFKEVDTADMRGIDMVRELNRIAHYKTTGGSCRVILLDECHKMTNDAQNALLKLLEDPPPNVFFILATTDPQKLIKTIITRCTSFELKPLPQNELCLLLMKVARAEGKLIKPTSLQKITEGANGSPRGALQILEKVIDYPIDQLEELITNMESFDARGIDLARALIKRAHWSEILKILAGLTEPEESIRRCILGYSTTVLSNPKTSTADQARAYVLLTCFERPYYDTGRAGLIMSCYEAKATK